MALRVRWLKCAYLFAILVVSFYLGASVLDLLEQNHTRNGKKLARFCSKQSTAQHRNCRAAEIHANGQRRLAGYFSQLADMS
jgi:hypothetical protein